jgi:REP-associated tyrosine transposase
MKQTTRHNSWILPVEEFHKHKRYLPHLQTPGGYYFTDSNTHNRRILSEEERDIVFDAIKFLDGRKYDLLAAVVMPDHFHLIIHPIEKKPGAFYSLSEIFHSTKSFTANKIGGRVWQDENYDHIIRNEKDYYEKLVYLMENPVDAGLVASYEEYRWFYLRPSEETLAQAGSTAPRDSNTVIAAQAGSTAPRDSNTVAQAQAGSTAPRGNS